ncbi:class 3 adenylate cyclase/rubredoxin [Bacillus mesophilus]|uniref:Adenylate/guanylate cyclase domain-containing protein n=1 Tax=Bacillus mesophilus TaxID=1808955 RepID=A0A6M0Q9I6_9BACI|nr:adenylate/guanylate cyclase domain-containing protein [Bacillus mesophilus]MBM7662339.1 class 3 adenylate cyclase/rubredoxin [Bacillus mesophilus]NEY73031.1 adenylate/guanylate cyclase domain-containing protein [Bacillus mesophilus]
MKYSAKKYIIEQHFPLSKEKIWELLGDTDRLNRFIGLFPVTFSPAKKVGDDTFYRLAEAKVAGLVPIVWREYPFQWVTNESYMVERRYEKGPLAHFLGGIELYEQNNKAKTTVRLIGEFTPRNLLGKAALPFTAVRSMHLTMKYLHDYLSNKVKDQTAYTPKKVTNKVNIPELTKLETQLSKLPVDSSYIPYLHQHLVEKMDHDVTQMRPYELARHWGVNPDEVLRLFLYATKVGILNLSWNLICPNCRVSKVSYNTLSQLENEFHCDLCGINYDANFENYVELYFSVHPSVRKAYAQSYCVGGPMISPHVKIQKVIEKGETYKTVIPPYHKKLRIRVLQANHTVDIQSVPSNQSKQAVELDYRNSGWSESTISVTPGNTAITIHNSSPEDIVVVVEQGEWSQEVVTAAKITALQEFRDLFSSEVLAPGQQVGIENVTILFSDLQGSTSLYEVVGDADAYGQVRRHFDYLTEMISKNSGSVVKTIGDAVMAVFHKPEDGFQAALHIQKHIAEFNDKNAGDITLKVGLYSGPAIAVNSNDRIDYFGRTVNIAARIQGQSTGNDIVFHKEYLNNSTIQFQLEKEDVILESFHANLRGISDSIELVRLQFKKTDKA